MLEKVSHLDFYTCDGGCIFSPLWPRWAFDASLKLFSHLCVTNKRRSFTLKMKLMIARTMTRRQPQTAKSTTMRFSFSSQSMSLQRTKDVWMEFWHPSTEVGKMSSDQVGTPHVKAGSNVQLGCTLPLSFTGCNLTRVFRSSGCQAW